MLPVQTVMIRYMVLVYRWGSRWFGSAGDWEGFAGGFAGGDVRGGGARRRELLLPDPGAKRPRRRGAGGAFKGEFYSVDSSGLFIELFMTLSDLLV